MEQNSGFILLHRKLRDNFLWQDKPFSKGQAWIDMLFMANHSNNEVLYGNQITVIKRGSFIRSERQLADSWGWSRASVRRFLGLLENRPMIERKPAQKASQITILNYDKYQVFGTNKRPNETEKAAQTWPKPGPKQRMKKNEKEYFSSNNRVPHKAIVSLYHEILPELPAVKVWSSERQKTLRVRWKEDPKRQSLDWWRGFFEYVKQSSWLIGDNPNKWQPNFEWLLEKKHFVNVIEGKYHNG